MDDGTATEATPIPDSHRDILQREGFAHLASIGPDGEPQSHPVWYEFDGANLRISTTEGRQKLENIRRDGRVAMTIQDPSDPYRYIEVRGRVNTIEPDSRNEFIDSLAARYLDQEYPWHQPGDRRVIISIKPIKTNTMG